MLKPTVVKIQLCLGHKIYSINLTIQNDKSTAHRALYNCYCIISTQCARFQWKRFYHSKLCNVYVKHSNESCENVKFYKQLSLKIINQENKVVTHISMQLPTTPSHLLSTHVSRHFCSEERQPISASVSPRLTHISSTGRISAHPNTVTRATTSNHMNVLRTIVCRRGQAIFTDVQLID